MTFKTRPLFIGFLLRKHSNHLKYSNFAYVAPTETLCRNSHSGLHFASAINTFLTLVLGEGDTQIVMTYKSYAKIHNLKKIAYPKGPR